MSTALVIGASSGIGEAVARRLIAAGWTVVGIARRAPAIEGVGLPPRVADVRLPDYRAALVGVLARLGPARRLRLCRRDRGRARDPTEVDLA